MSVVDLTTILSEKESKEGAFLNAALLSLPTRIELDRLSESERSYQEELDNFIREIVEQILSGELPAESEKKNLRN